MKRLTALLFALALLCGLFCCVSQSNAAFSCTIVGLMDEETGLILDAADRAVDVTAYFPASSGVPSESFTVNGSYSFSSASTPLYFKFDIGSSDREYYVTAGDAGGTIYIFNSTVSAYVIQFSDLTGILKSYPIVEVKRNINGSEIIVEKRLADATGKVYASLVYGQTYSISIGDGSNSYTYGTVLFQNDASVELPLRGLEFPDTIQIGYKYVKVYVTRDASNIVYLSYSDSTDAAKGVTSNVDFKVYFQDNYTLAYSNSFSGADIDSWSDTWTGASNTTDYVTIVTITHSLFGAMDYRQVLPRLFGNSAPFSLAVLGTLPFDTAYLIPVFIILCAAAAVSAFNSYIGLFVVCVLAALFAWWGWLPISVDVLVFGFGLTIIFAIVMLKRRVTTY